MDFTFTPFESLKKWRDQNFAAHRSNPDELQRFHEAVFKSAFEITLELMTKSFGPPPCEYSWFVMGSAGRCEQALYSDQDHGLVFADNSTSHVAYFLELGKMLSNGLDYLGYPLCTGGVMSSNPLWCKSYEDWHEQIINWMKKEQWETLRYLLIFSDARTVVGNEALLLPLKRAIFHEIKSHPNLLVRLLENTMYREKALGIFHQLLPISSGPFTGCINLKNAAFLPYINAIRLLALKEGIIETATLKRLTALAKLPNYQHELENYHMLFSGLLKLALKNGLATNYRDVHYVKVKSLNHHEKQELKQILAEANKLQTLAEMIVKGR